VTSAAPHAESTGGTYGRGSALARVTAALEAAGCGPLRRGMARCPAHDDRTPSLSVSQGDRGAVLHCFADCELDDVLRALGLEARDLFDADEAGPRARRTNGAERARVVATYPYCDERGELLYQAVRYDPKDFRQRRPDGRGGWVWNLGDVRRVLYRLPDVLRAVAAGDRIYVLEGEKDADAGWDAGLVATTHPGGAGKWRAEYAEALRDAEVVIVADRDEPGRRHARAVAASLRGVARSVEIREAAEGKDLADHLAAGRTVDELLRGQASGPASEADALGAGGPEPVEPSAVGFTGARLLALLDRPPIAPVEPGVPAAGHFNLLVAPSFTGKTSLVCWLAMARAGGVAPWAGATPLEAGRVLIVSIDEAAEQVARRMNALATFHPAGRLVNLAERVVVIGPDRDLPPGALDALHLDAEGLATLERLIARAAMAGAPFREVYLDAYADFLPLGASENSNEEGTRIGGALEGIAIRTEAAVMMLHHTGKPKDPKADALPDLRYIGRGASALMAKARVVAALEAVAGQPNVRRIRVVTNLTRAPGPAFFEVASDKAAEGELIYFRAFDPLNAYDPSAMLPGPDEEPISTGELAWRLTGKDREAGEEPPGEVKSLASKLREQWLARGLVDVSPGPRNAKLIRLRRTPQ